MGGALHRLLIGLVLLGCAACFFLFFTDQNRSIDRKGACLLISALLLAGALGFYRGAGERASFERSIAAGAHLLRAGREITITGTVVGEVRRWRNGQRFVFRVEDLLPVDQDFPGVEGRRSGGFLLKCEVFLEEQLVRDPEVGDCLRLTGVFSALTWPEGGENPVMTWWTREKIAGGFFVKAMGSHGLAARAVLAGKSRLNPVTVYISRLRRRLLRIGEETLSPQSAEVLHSMLFGEWIEFDQKTTEGIRRTGVAHLFSVSGLHLIFWLSLFLGVGKLLRLPTPLLSFLSIPVVLVFVLIAGLQPPAIRAAVMYFLALAGKICAQPRNRAVSGENLLSVTACLSLLWRPLDLFSKSFWLSYGACVGIFVFYPPWKRVLGRWGRYQPAQAILLSSVIQIVIMPLLINFFGGVSVLTPIANLLLVPLATLALQIGLLAAVGGLFFFPAAQLLNAGNELILNILRRLLQFCSTWPGYLPAEPWPWLTVGCFYVALAILTSGVNRNPLTKNRRIPLFYFYLAILLPAVVFVGWNLIFQTNPDLIMVVFDVGQGDSILLSTTNGCHILVDGGTREGFDSEVKPYLEANGLTNLDLLVVTHPHEDHLGGAVRLLEEGKVNVRMVLDSGYPHTTRLYQKFISLIKERRIPYQRAVRGMDFRLGDGEPRWHGLVLHPPDPFLSGTGADLNNNSVVLLLTYGPVRILLPGDLEVQGKENLLTAYHGSLRAQILKVAHHGSAGANSRQWLQRTAPEIAVISVGWENPFGHPSTTVLQDLQSSGARVLRTDLDGRLVLEIKILKTERKVMVRRGK
ncbi:MAG TPA: DNA internalization-related competence protein ComEC/Rec2 [Firmicutes bacterium]|nr:DNA internalization-related competence protein ComEC/Rec2 [Bacillota bacterium]